MYGWIPDPNSIYKDTVLDHPVKICQICRNREEFFSVDLEKLNNFGKINEEPKNVKETITERLEALEKRVAELENELGTAKKRRLNERD